MFAQLQLPDWKIYDDNGQGLELRAPATSIVLHQQPKSAFYRA